MPFLLIVAIALAALIAVSFLGWDWEASLALILILTLGVGILVGYLAGLPSKMKKSGQLRQAKKELEGLEELATELEPAGDVMSESPEGKI
jgi:putative membrane protein